ncbi:MAG: transposase, partial [Elusimicrobiota bacterium]
MTGELFKELFPYGGQLNPDNQWIKLEELVPWAELEEIYRKYFSHLGRPGKDSQLVNGLLIVKHMKGYSDEGVVEQFSENPYIQYFCGYEQFVKGGEIESSTLTRMRKRLGVEYFKKFELEILDVLKSRKIIKTKEQMVDATVFPANITYPTDTGLIEKARQWVVQKIKLIIKFAGIKEKVRTYCRKARATYLKFQKKRKKTQKEIMLAKKQALQFLRRNIFQLEGIIVKTKDIPMVVLDKIIKQLEVARKIYEQQKEML